MKTAILIISTVAFLQFSSVNSVKCYWCSYMGKNIGSASDSWCLNENEQDFEDGCERDKQCISEKNNDKCFVTEFLDDGDLKAVVRYGGADDETIDNLKTIAIGEDWRMVTTSCDEDLCNGASSINTGILFAMMAGFVLKLIS